MKKVVISPSVEIAMRPLDANGARQLNALFDNLRRWDEDEALRRNSILLDSIPGVYVLRTTTDIRIFFRIDGDTITLLDVAKTPAILTSGGIGFSDSVKVVVNPDQKVK
jgi:hypothetical protein